MPLLKPRSRAAAAICAGMLLSSVLGASASSLGSITPRSLGADTTAVLACDTDGVTASYVNTWSAPDAAYRTTSATITGIAAGCSGSTLQFTMADDLGAPLATSTVTVSGTSQVLAYSPGPLTDAVATAAIVISG